MDQGKEPKTGGSALEKGSAPVKEGSRALQGLLAGIFLWGIVFGLICFFVGEGKVVFLASLWAGVAVAAWMAFHMYRSIGRSLDMASFDAVSGMKKGAVLRMLVVVAAILLVWRLHGSFLGMFLGLFTLKFAAYSQPLLEKLLGKAKRS